MKLIAIVPVILITSALLVSLLNSPNNSSEKQEKTGVVVSDDGCTQPLKTHTVEIQGGVFVPKEVHANYCDELLFVNKDSKSYLLAFGEHDQHAPYGDFVEEIVNKGEKISIYLLYKGTYRFHDHNNDEMYGTLKVE